MMFKYMCLVLFITWYQLADCHPAKSDEKSIDSMIDKESEAFLSVEADESSQKTVRDKRTIGFLRQLFPNFSQIVDRKIQQITRFLFRVIGRLVLRGGAGGGAGAGAAGGTTNGGGGASESGNPGGRRISITLPTFPPSADDEDEDQSTEVPVAVTSESVESRAADAVNTTPLPPAAAADSVAAASSIDSGAETVVVSTEAPAAATDATTTTTINATTTNAGTTTKAEAANSPTTQRPSDADNTVGTVMKRTAREASTEDTSSAQKRSPLTDTENNEVPSDNALQNSDDTQVENEEDPRNKRFLLNLRGGGGGGGSGNFLFDLIRLVAGSGANQDRDESGDSAPLETEAQEVRADLNGKEDGYSVGVPGPLTRIFVIANRGVANLVQDLILRLAQTTERIVNFKARLITSLI